MYRLCMLIFVCNLPLNFSCTASTEARGGTDPFESGRRLLEENYWRKTMSQAQRLIAEDVHHPQLHERTLLTLLELRSRASGNVYPSVSMGLRRRLDRLIARFKTSIYGSQSAASGFEPSELFRPYRFSWPVRTARITSGFGDRRDPFHSGRISFHSGIDLAGLAGDPVFATGPGRIVFAGWREDGCGLAITLVHPGGFVSDYCHLAALEVELGSYVAPRSVIARMGDTGRSTGPHLHWGLWHNGVAVDPHQYVGRFVTGPWISSNAPANRSGK